MLLKRFITAIVLLIIFVGSMICQTPGPFVTVIAVLIAGGFWEWSRLNGWGGWRAILAAILGLAVCVLSWYFGILFAYLPAIWWVFGLGWIGLGGLILFRGIDGWRAVPPFVRNLTGYLAMWTTFVSIIQAWTQGLNLLLSMLVLVWVTDIAAYFAGRAWGGKLIKRKLAPQISPKKTWEGFIGGAMGAVLTAYIWLYIDRSFAVDTPSLFSRINAISTLLMPIAVFLLSIMAVVGDLLESLCKRAARVKDSSQLLPGHGGVLDRVDAILPVLPLAMLFCIH